MIPADEGGNQPRMNKDARMGSGTPANPPDAEPPRRNPPHSLPFAAHSG